MGGKGILSQYVEFARIGDQCIKEYGKTRKAAEATIERCISRGILVDYLQGRKREVRWRETDLFGWVALPCCAWH